VNMTDGDQEIRVVSYNILSNELVDEEDYPFCDPKHLQEDYRKDLLQKLLQSEVDQKTIICLQEVSTDWAAWLLTWFDSRDYYFINTQWSGHHNGYMGTSIAFSKDKFLLKEVKFPHAFRNTYKAKPISTFASICAKYLVPGMVVVPIIASTRRYYGNRDQKGESFLDRALPFYLLGSSVLAAQAVYD